MEKIKVAIVIPYFGVGGAEKMAAQLAAGVDQELYTVEVFCIYGEPLGNHLEQMVQGSGVKIHFIGKKLGFSVSAMVRLYRELEAFDPDVVHTHQYACVYAFPWPLLHGKNFLHTFHTLPQVENKRLVRRLLTKYLVGRKKMTPVSISKAIQQMVADYYGLSPEEVPMVNNPVTVSCFAPTTGVDDGVFRFVTAGRFSKEKNQAMMYRAFAAFLEKGYDARLVMLGKGAEEENLKALAETLGISDRIDYPGFVPNVEDYLTNADVFLLSSNYEALPLAVLEAMAAGLPVISTNVGGVCDIVTDNGILIPAGDMDAMVQAMEKLYLNGDVRAQMAAASAKNVRTFDVTNTVAGYCALYSRSAEQKK